MSGGLTDVDLDCAEAVRLAAEFEFLPPTTAVYGRPSKRRSHHLYTTQLHETETHATLQFKEGPELNPDPKTAMLVELRIGGGGKGACSMVPPSVHKSGELITWDQEGVATTVEGGELKKRAALLAAASLLGRHYPAVGARHSAALVLGGVLARAAWKEEHITWLVGAVAKVAGDEESADRVEAAASALAHLAAGEDTPGLPRMREEWGTAVADLFAEWIGYDANGGARESSQATHSGDQLVLPAGAPMVAADEFIKHCWMVEGIPLLWAYRGAFYRYTGTHYREYADESIERDLYKFLNKALAVAKAGGIGPFNPTKGKVFEVVHALRRNCLIPQDWETPCWLEKGGLEKGGYRPAKKLLSCRNGILDLETRQLEPHDPSFFVTNCLPLDYDPSSPKPKRWLRFLEELWPADKEGHYDHEAVETLQEIFGYMLANDTQQQKIFLIIGPPRSGKGTLVHVLVLMLGDDNSVFPTLSSMSGEFGRWPLIDKKLAAITDARISSKADTHRIAEMLLSISGGDPQTINRKNQAFWTGRLSVRFMITTNVLPAIRDASGTIATRYILLKLSESFLGREDLNLKAALSAEMTGILNWALDGLDRLRERGFFRMPASSAESIRELEDAAEPVKAFLREWCERGPDQRINVKEFYRAYRAWAEEAGLQLLAKNSFGRVLRGLLPKLTTTGVGAKRDYVGAALGDHGKEQFAAIMAEKGRKG
jgi:putative DNA primase/helicase